MDIKERNSHCDDHRNKNDSYHKACYKKKGTAELNENRKHQCHITSKTENAWIGIRQLIKIDHFVEAMSKKHDTYKDSEQKNKN
jgi:hypothetical protein